jgi:hypothetical protein
LVVVDGEDKDVDCHVGVIRETDVKIASGLFVTTAPSAQVAVVDFVVFVPLLIDKSNG